MNRHVCFVACLFASLMLAGCGSSEPPAPKKYPVSGKVTQDGKPLPEGTILFKTIATGSVQSLEIKDGEFQGESEAGERRIEINAYRIIKGDFNGMKGEVQESLIPARYNVESTLTAKVTAGGTNQFTFEVSSEK